MDRKDDTQFKLRLPGDLKAWVCRQAKANHRSQNAEIVHRLEQAREQQEKAA